MKLAEKVFQKHCCFNSDIVQGGEGGGVQLGLKVVKKFGHHFETMPEGVGRKKGVKGDYKVIIKFPIFTNLWEFLRKLVNLIITMLSVNIPHGS